MDIISTIFYSYNTRNGLLRGRYRPTSEIKTEVCIRSDINMSDLNRNGWKIKNFSKNCLNFEQFAIIKCIVRGKRMFDLR